MFIIPNVRNFIIIYASILSLRKILKDQSKECGVSSQPSSWRDLPPLHSHESRSEPSETLGHKPCIREYMALVTQQHPWTHHPPFPILRPSWWILFFGDPNVLNFNFFFGWANQNGSFPSGFWVHPQLINRSSKYTPILRS